MDDSITLLPVYGRLGEIADEFARARLLLLTAETGAGKTTLVPWRLLSHPAFSAGRILLLEPRRIAARAAAERIAFLAGEPLGKSVGLHTRHETVTGPHVRLEVITEGVLLRIIQNDQSLEGYSAIIFDEFHERNLPAELGLALAWDCRAALRDDLALLVMSATLPVEDFTKAFGGWPILTVPGRSHPVETGYRPPAGNERIETGAARLAIEAAGMMGSAPGDVLVFLPGYREIQRAADLLARETAGSMITEILHGRNSPDEQRRVLHGFREDRRRIILATNVAESSLTIPGVRAVVDTGFERRVRFSPRTGMDHRDTARISAASAAQRAGRAGRMGPGICLRWWNPGERLEPHAAPEIVQADLSPLALETAAWGARDARELTWITPPPQAHLERARALLCRLGLLDAEGGITPVGTRAAGMGMHPRLARMAGEAAHDGRLFTACLIAAILEEGEGPHTGSVDFRDRIEAWMAWERGQGGSASNGSMHRIADEARRVAGSIGGVRSRITAGDIDPSLAGALLLLAYPDRAARRTVSTEGAARYVTAEGRGAVPVGRIGTHEFIVALEMDGGATEARVYSAAPVERAEIERALAPLEEITEASWSGWTPSVRVIVRAAGLRIGERRGKVSPDTLGTLALERLHAGGIALLPWDGEPARLRARCLFVERRALAPGWPEFSDDALVRDAHEWLLPFAATGGGPVFTGASVMKALESRLGYRYRPLLDTLAPAQVTLPSGSRRAVDYESGDIPVIAARLQEFFGCADTPLIGGAPALLHLLSPAGRPVQVTRDLGGFWTRTYPEVRRELLGRYPRHYWPDDPMQAEPTSRAKPRKR
ncbi:MAG: ATP-dependent helicase HrpB [Spirochaetes bacterium]|nr:MAG: ATP-dependent helicase HrpB [Spirochaetota bacterium]